MSKKMDMKHFSDDFLRLGMIEDILTDTLNQVWNQGMDINKARRIKRTANSFVAVSHSKLMLLKAFNGNGKLIDNSESLEAPDNSETPASHDAPIHHESPPEHEKLKQNVMDEFIRLDAIQNTLNETIFRIKAGVISNNTVRFVNEIASSVVDVANLKIDLWRTFTAKQHMTFDARELLALPEAALPDASAASPQPLLSTTPTGFLEERAVNGTRRIRHTMHNDDPLTSEQDYQT